MEGQRASMMTVNGRGARATGSERERVPSDRGWSERRRVGDGEPRRRVGEVVLGLPTGVCLEEDHHRPQGCPRRRTAATFFFADKNERNCG